MAIREQSCDRYATIDASLIITYMKNSIGLTIPKLQLGILDIGAFHYGKQSSVERISETIITAKKAEKLGFTRYWIGEHHSNDVAWRGTGTMLTLIASSTSKIRVGSAGILLNYYNPLMVSADYKLLANLFNKRIDLGLAEGIAEVNLIDKMLSMKSGQEHMTFLEKAKFINSVYSENADPIFISPPYTNLTPDIWMLGTSLRKLDFAIEQNFNYCLSLCHKDQSLTEMQALAQPVRSSNYLKKTNDQSQITIMLNVICGRTNQHARKMVTRSFSNLQLSFYGDQKSCYEFLIEMKTKFGVSEIIIADQCGNQKDRIFSLSSLAELID